MTTREKAIALHDQGFNCAQSVLLSLGDKTGLEDHIAADIATGFGRGAGCRELCGAVSGAIAAAGIKLGAENRQQIYDFDEAIMLAFREKFGAVRCEDLEAAKISCNDLIAFAAEKAEELLSSV